MEAKTRIPPSWQVVYVHIEKTVRKWHGEKTVPESLDEVSARLHGVERLRLNHVHPQTVGVGHADTRGVNELSGYTSPTMIRHRPVTPRSSNVHNVCFIYFHVVVKENAVHPWDARPHFNGAPVAIKITGSQ